MDLTPEEQSMLNGEQGYATRKAMQILVALGTIYGAERLIPVSSVQVAGVSYDNLGEAGLEFLTELADGGGKARVLATLNPAGVDVDNREALGISEEFGLNQARVIEAFTRMGILPTCTCTPYLAGNLPHFGEHLAWAESSAVCFANAVLGARTNREGGPSALAAALTGRTPEYGLHLEANRRPPVRVIVRADLAGPDDFGALGQAAGTWLERQGKKAILYFQGIPEASLESLKALCASLATYGGAGIFQIEGITPEAGLSAPPEESIELTTAHLEEARLALNSASPEEVDFISLGCPHLSIAEIAHLAQLLEGQRVQKTFWVTTSRAVKTMSDRFGYTKIIEDAGAVFAADTCCVVAPIQRRFKALATDSAKACYYASARNRFKTVFLPFEEVVRLALGNEPNPKSTTDTKG